jgi:polysaccharide export outer membrane protein
MPDRFASALSPTSAPAVLAPAVPSRPKSSRVLRAALLGALTLPGLAACLPASGPTASAIRGESQAADPAFDVVALDTAVADRLAAIDAPSLHSFGGGTGALGTGGAADLRIGTGDTVVVSIFEAASGGLFSGDASAAGGSKSISLPPQPVARNGTISVPYVGQVKVAGLTPAQVQAAVEAGLKDKAIEPQVLVTVASSASTFVTVAGDVGQPGRVPLNLGGDRLLDVIAGAGGAKAPAYDSFVRLTRGGRTVTVSLAAIVDDPRQNIYLRPDDQVYLVTDPQIYTAFGATARNASFPFETDRLTLAEAVGRAGGLNDNRANPRGVFVFRYEDPQAYALIRGSSGAVPAAYAQAPGGQAGIPVIYELNLREPQSLFAAQRFLMRDNDILYVSNAASTDLQKVFGTISGGVGTGLSAATLSTRVID